MNSERWTGMNSERWTGMDSERWTGMDSRLADWPGQSIAGLSGLGFTVDCWTGLDSD